METSLWSANNSLLNYGTISQGGQTTGVTLTLRFPTNTLGAGGGLQELLCHI
jgi:hypothetical protein